MRIALVAMLGTILFIAPLDAQEIPPELEDLKEPRIVLRLPQSVLVVEARGDPTTVGSRAFGLLFQLYYQSPVTPKGPQQPAPRARWPVEFDAPRSEWFGIYALPVPEDMTELPAHTPPPGFEAKLTVWEYGEVAEILHVGPYGEEEPTIARLKEFIEAAGYEISGPHEEEYIRGPTMSGPGDPAGYLTILRYEVQEASRGVGP